MTKFLPFFLLFSYSALSCFALQIDARPSLEPQIDKPAAEPSPELLTLELDRTVLETFCPPAMVPAPRPCDEKVARIKVTARYNEAIDKSRSYYYRVSAGRILGSGPEVIWEIETLTAGSYTIDVATGKNRILDGPSARSELLIRECSTCHIGCECPNIVLSGPTGAVTRGSTIVVDVEITEPFNNESKTWKVIGGQILSGQNTHQIFVLVDALDRDYLEIEFELSGTEPHCDCPVFHSLSIPILN